ncbi:MAG: hypothetical protein M3P08_03510 [Thermoproteota archaeon]|nr:hypothetical protein [Thermoproteota archaeon]
MIQLDDKTKNGGITTEDENYSKIEIVHLQTRLQTKVTTLIVDRKLSLEIEVNPDETTGLATYSNSEATV